MPLDTSAPAGVKCCTWLRAIPFLAVLGATGLFLYCSSPSEPALPLAANDAAEQQPEAEEAPELEGGTAWLNTAGPLRLKDLRGKVVLLDFWTFCCINCIHVIPDLVKLEQKYADQLVVIGVHSAKFDNEKDTENIRKAILRYEISHPVVNDSQMKIWQAYHVRSWPTLCLIDPEGRLVGHTSGEGQYELLDHHIGNLVRQFRAKKLLNEKPLRFELAQAKETGDSPLFFPGKVLADAASQRLFIADSTHHRIVITDLTGKKIAIAGSGAPGKTSGPFAEAKFNDPQGLALKGDTLYVADRKNHTVRALDLKAGTVETIAGTGRQGREDRVAGGPALKVSLNSPWDLWLQDQKLYIAMAGHHQIWVLDLATKMMAPFAGNGRETIVDGPPEEASFAQPSGLTSDGKSLFVADSEVSAIRSISLDGRAVVSTIVGEGLFKFGDRDGAGKDVLLQHALGVAYHAGKLYVADTYNGKIKELDPEKRTCRAWLGGGEGWLGGRLFYEPAGLSIASGKMYVADTNAHRIRVVDMDSKKVATLTLQGVEAPRVAK